MTVTQAVLEAAEDGFRYVFGDDPKTPRVHAIKALIDAAREQLGQQAAAPGVEQVRAAIEHVYPSATFDDEGWAYLSVTSIDMKEIAIALAVAPPPVRSDETSIGETFAYRSSMADVGRKKPKESS